MITALKTQVKKALLPLIYRYPPTGLQPERLALYLMGLLNRRQLNLPVAEVGCHLGGTTAIAYTALRRTGWDSTYTCYDTFGGFVDDQFKADAALGTPADRQSLFSANSAGLVRSILNYHECQGVKLVQGDITTVPETALAPQYGVVLLDIDLSDPTHKALHRFWPRIAPGGAIFVDDCPESSDWKARRGYARFCREMGLIEKYEFGLGILERTS